MKMPVTVAMFALLAAVHSAHAVDQNLARNLAATCANCHGTNGHALAGSGIDALAGVPRTVTLQKLAEFRSGSRPATIMHQIVKGYTDEQLDLIAGYLAAQK